MKTNDSELTKLQALILDPVGPLVKLLHGLDNPDGFFPDEAHASISEAICLLGNASSHLSRLRCKKVLKSVNPDIHDLADEESLFKSAAPNLFGAGFETKMKEQAESLKLLSSSKAQPPPRSFFTKVALLPPSGGGQMNRGGRQWQRKEKPTSSHK